RHRGSISRDDSHPPQRFRRRGAEQARRHRRPRGERHVGGARRARGEQLVFPTVHGVVSQGGAGTVPDPFSPADIAGLKLWLDATAITGLSDSDPVTTWVDQSGEGNDATQSSSGAK